MVTLVSAKATHAQTRVRVNVDNQFPGADGEAD